MPWSVYNSNGKLLQSLAISDDSIVEGKLDVSNAPTNGYVLQAQSGEGGGLTWVAAADASLVPKAWVSIATNGSIQEDEGISTIGDTGAGDRDVNFDTAFAAATFAVAGGLGDGVSHGKLRYGTRTTADVNILTTNDAGAAADRGSSHAFYGAQ